MTSVIKTIWARKTKNDYGITKTWYTWRKIALDLPLMFCGAVIMYFFGRLAGQGIDHIPHLNGWISQVINYLSGIDVEGNLSGLSGLLGGLWGMIRAGIHLDDKTLEMKEIRILPFLCYKKEANARIV